MPLFLLERREDLPGNEEENPWFWIYDKVTSMVVRADDEIEARLIAGMNAGFEEYVKRNGESEIRDTNPWMSSEYSICNKLKERGKKEVVIVKFVNG